jgi:hypothetical protein
MDFGAMVAPMERTRRFDMTRQHSVDRRPEALRLGPSINPWRGGRDHRA